MIKRVIIEGYRGVKFADVRLSGLDLLAGMNGSGKSALLGALDLARRAAESVRWPSLMGAIDSDGLRHFDLSGDMPVGIRLESGDGRAFELEIKGYGGDNRRVGIKCEGPGGSRGFSDLPTRDWFRLAPDKVADALGGCGEEFAAAIRGLRVYSFGGLNPLANVSDVYDCVHLHADGRNIAAWLYMLRAEEPQSYHWIERMIKMRFPFIREIVLGLEEDGRGIRFQWIEERSARLLDGGLLSGGAGAYIALCALLRAPSRLMPPLTLIDCPETGLDPDGLVDVAELASLAASRGSATLMATRSARLVDEFDGGDLLIAYRIAGGCKYARLDPERLRAHLEDESLGSLWERNVLGGRGGSTFLENLSGDRAAIIDEANAKTFGYV